MPATTDTDTARPPLTSIVAELALGLSPCLVLGSLPLAAQLVAHIDGAIFGELRLPPRKLLRRHDGSFGALRVARDALPWAPKSFAAIIAVDTLDHGDAGAALAEYCRCLEEGGTLIVVEALRGAAGHALRSFGRGLRRFAPEDLTALLLNAEVSAPRQRWPAERYVVTVGQLRRT